MVHFSKSKIRNEVADSTLIFNRGLKIYEHGSYFLSDKCPEFTWFLYHMDGNYGNYETRIEIKERTLEYSCSCPYPGKGCKHVVAAALSTRDLLGKQSGLPNEDERSGNSYLSEQEIRDQAFKDRKKRAQLEKFKVVQGDLLRGDHLVITKNHREYVVTLHDPKQGVGHCTCPDYMTSGLGTCKHILFLSAYLKKAKGFKSRMTKERFPFVDIFWDSSAQAPRLFAEKMEEHMPDLLPAVKTCFSKQGTYRHSHFQPFMDLLDQIADDKRVRIRESLLDRIGVALEKQQLEATALDNLPDSELSVALYPYQKEGVRFGLLKPGVLIGDEMGLGKTLQGISLGVLKKKIFGYSKILVITLASLKEQWKREIEKFSREKALVIAGTPDQRKDMYFNDDSLFKVTNYEAVLRDVLMLARWKPDLIILDEAQRIKNFSTKTADAVKQIPKKQAIVLTGTPLENKLEDVYSIVQFLDPYKLSPLWKFASDHFLIPKKKKAHVAGYRNLDLLKEKLKDMAIRRTKDEVIKDLPEEVVNNYYIDLTDEQQKIHGGYTRSLLPLLNKKFLTPVDMQRIQALLLKMRQVCDSTYLIDRETQISPKLKELEGIVEELVIQNRRKMVIFSEWTAMTYLIARHLSDAGIHFVELSGKVPVKKRQALIDEFTANPDCRVFLSTDAGGTGLNLQAADCVVNFELPWNPARMNQRIGRVSRIGQQSSCINVINLIAKNSIEERILAGIQLKTDLFKGVFDDGPDTVEFSREKKNEMLNRLRQMMGDVPEPDLPESEPAVQEEIPEDLPYYLNPQVMEEKKMEEALSEPLDESRGMSSSAGRSGSSTNDPAVDGDHRQVQDILLSQPPEKIEEVLNFGMKFVSGLMEMATGQKVQGCEGQDKMVSIDRTTGEVSMKFKLPGF